MSRVMWLPAVLLLASCTTNGPQESDREKLQGLADIYLEASLEQFQPFAYFSNLPLDRHDRFLDNRPESQARFEALQDDVLASLAAMSPTDPEDRLFHARFTEYLEADIGTRICRLELWGVSHMFGPHSLLQSLVNNQPMATASEREQALARWQDAASWYEREPGNLERGLASGHTAPNRVVNRLVTQLANLVAIPVDDHPYLALAKRTDDEAFQTAFRDLLDNRLIPAIEGYVAYLRDDYANRTRESLALSAIPDGRACYAALYRRQTSLERTPEEVFELGSATVNRFKEEVSGLGTQIYGTRDFEGAVAAAKTDDRASIESPEQMLALYEAVAERSRVATTSLVHAMPTIPLVVEAIPEYQQGTGRSAHYQSGSNDRPGKFRYDPTTYENENAGSAEIVTVHEGYPGHHLQIALVHDREEYHPVERMFRNAAYTEGWARYAEALSEEVGIYQTDAALILRRAWPARGMVLDPALHILGWSNEELTRFAQESGRFDDAAPLLDRMAIMPAQLTAYDSGALEILALRQLMQDQLGDNFDVRDFHQLILENGNVPLSELRRSVERYLEDIAPR